jgi:hypothetical protein
MTERRTLHGDDLYAVMPSEEELPRGWFLDAWWSIRRRGPTFSRVYLNGGGSDHELRFILHHPKARELPCNICKATGRVNRPASEPSTLFTALAKPGREHDPADENGLRRCFVCGGDGTVRPYYGAANDFIRVPGLHPHFRNRHLGSRGLAHPDKDDVMKVMEWIDWLYPILLKGETP